MVTYSGRRPEKIWGAYPKPYIYAGFLRTPLPLTQPPPHTESYPVKSGRRPSNNNEHFLRIQTRAWAGPWPSPPRRPDPGSTPSQPHVHRDTPEKNAKATQSPKATPHPPHHARRQPPRPGHRPANTKNRFWDATNRFFFLKICFFPNKYLCL